MKILQFPKFKDYTNQKVNFIQPKLDGHLCKIYNAKSVALLALTKNDKDITEKLLSIDHIRKELDGLPDDSIIFAELHCPGRFATDVPTMLNDADENLQLTAFAAPLLDGMNHIDNNLTNVMFIIRDSGLDATYADIWPDDIVDDAHKIELLQKAIERKWEGWVLKESHMAGWYKLKPVKTIDAFVIATHQSFSTTHYGGLQSIQIGIIDNGKMRDLGQVGSGFTLIYRQRFNSKIARSQLLDRVCEIAYDSIAANGKLRFPRFVRWRDDKNISDCTIDQLEN